MYRYFKNFNFLCGFVMIFVIFLSFLLSFFYTPYSPTEMDPKSILVGPSFKHLMGTDNLGRDIFSRILIATQSTLLIGFGSTFLSLIIGTIIGAFLGYYGGTLDILGMRFINILMSFPKILLALVVITMFGNGVFKIILVLGIISIPKFARFTRINFFQGREFDYVKSAKIKGISNFRIMFIHILPNFKVSIIINITNTFSSNVLSEAGLSYLGLGLQPPNPSLGRMVSESQIFLNQAPWYIFFTGTMIFLLVLGSNLFGDGINEINNMR